MKGFLFPWSLNSSWLRCCSHSVTSSCAASTIHCRLSRGRYLGFAHPLQQTKMYRLALASAPRFSRGWKYFRPSYAQVPPHTSSATSLPWLPKAVLPLLPFAEQSAAKMACMSLPVPARAPLWKDCGKECSSLALASISPSALLSTFPEQTQRSMKSGWRSILVKKFSLLRACWKVEESRAWSSSQLVLKGSTLLPKQYFTRLVSYSSLSRQFCPSFMLSNFARYFSFFILISSKGSLGHQQTPLCNSDATAVQ